jgi:hypothetical protein
MSLKPLRRRRNSRATEHSERPDGLPMADKSKMETLAATVVVPPSGRPASRSVSLPQSICSKPSSRRSAEAVDHLGQPVTCGPRASEGGQQTTS